jgi:hypothetical protein
MTGADLTALLKKHPLSTACGLVVVVCGGLLYWRSDAVSVSQAEYEAKSAEAGKMISNVKDAPGLEEQVKEIQALSKELEGRLMHANQLAVNLQYFYKLEADNNVKLLDLRQNPLPRNPAKTLYLGVPFTLTAQGTYPQVMKFLGAVQNGRHFCRIASANFTKAGGSASEGSGGAVPQLINLTLNLELLGQP